MNIRQCRRSAILITACIVGIAAVLILTKKGLRETDPVPRARFEEYEITLAEEAVPSTLRQWQSVNPEVTYVLEFTDEPVSRRIPVLLTADPQYAMTHNLYGEHDSMGSVFSDASESSFGSLKNLVIYGHSSRTKDWCFTFLKKYADEDYFDSHHQLRLEDENGTSVYDIVSLARYDLNLEGTWLGWSSPSLGSMEEAGEMFRLSGEYLLQQRNGILYHGQNVLTMVTCDMDEEDTRFVLQAVRRC